LSLAGEYDVREPILRSGFRLPTQQTSAQTYELMQLTLKWITELRQQGSSVDRDYSHDQGNQTRTDRNDEQRRMHRANMDVTNWIWNQMSHYQV
jgi:hypothetical protein